MARPSKHDGVVYRRNDSNIWWMRYRDRSGCRRLESTHTEDWQEAQRQLRERLQARDNNTLHIVRKGEQLAFGEWADFFLENYSKPPIRAASTHEANENALKSLRPVFGPMKMTEIDATQIEIHLRNRLKHRKACPPEGRDRGTRTPETRDRASGVSNPSAHLQRGRQEEALSGQSMRRRRVSCNSQGAVPAALHDVVGATGD